MGSWDSGYVSDIEYTVGFYREQAPSHLNLVALVNGCEPTPLSQPFTYCELGSGQGLTANLLAAANPRGEFYAVDFNPSHIASASRFASEAKLANIRFIEDSFADLADRETASLPAFDYITLHGVYTWITPENRKAIVRFIRRFLKPGGIVYASYNCMPGWTGALPMQRLLYEHAGLSSERSDRRFERAIAFAEELRQSELRYQLGNSFLDEILAKLRQKETRYLVHEYLNADWHPMFSLDVARELSEAKLDFAGSGDLIENFADLTLDGKQRGLLESAGAPELREMLKDFFINRRFRKDVFVRGARRLSRLAQDERLRQTRLALVVPRADVSFKLLVHRGEATLDADVYGPIFDALAEAPRTVDELLRLPAVVKRGMTTAAEIVGVLAGSGQAAPIPVDEVDGAASRRLNAALADRAVLEEAGRTLAIAAPRIGTGLGVNFFHLLACRSLLRGVASPEGVTDSIWTELKRRGERVIKEGKPVEGDDANLAVIREQVQSIFDKLLPIWRAQGAVPEAG